MSVSQSQLLSKPMLLNSSASLYDHLRNVIHFLQVVTSPSLPYADEQGAERTRMGNDEKLHGHCHAPWLLP